MTHANKPALGRKGARMEKMCCVCHRIKRVNGWVKVGKNMAVVKLSHGYCPACYRKTMQKVMDFGLQLNRASD